MPSDVGLQRALARPGGLSVAELLEQAATHYDRPQVIGAAGDFVTAPEISQCFGELVGLWLADCWSAAGAPRPCVLAELGPGRGTLMADLWRAAAVVPGFQHAAEVHLVERSAPLRALQRSAIGDASPTFHATVASLPDAPLFLVANEFLDALPVHQLVRRGAGWTERCLIRDVDGGLGWAERAAPMALAAAAERRFGEVQEGAVCEEAPTRAAIVAEVAGRIGAHGGAALFIDYGATVPAARDTLQAVRQHRPVDVLEHLGEADLTTAVSFAPLVEAAVAAGAAVFGPVPQATFLRALGIEMRAMRLASRIEEGAGRSALLAGVRRLLDPTAMGELFKVLAVVPRDARMPAGFTAAAAA